MWIYEVDFTGVSIFGFQVMGTMILDFIWKSHVAKF
jgi:hypothetical protein